MSRITRWEGDELYYLLTRPPREVAKKYGYSAKYIRTCKHRKLKEIKEGKIAMPPKPEQNPEARLVKSWEVSAFDREANEWTTTLNHSYEHQADEEALDQFTPAEPAKITPTRKKAPTRDYKTLFVFSDAQVDYRRLDDGTLDPIHDEKALEVGRLLCAELRPDFILNLGDTVDLAALSRFKPDSDHFHRTLGPSFQRVHDYYAQLRSDNPRARIIEVDSNHNTRLKDFMLKNAPQLYGVKQAGAREEEYPVFSYPYLTNLGHLGVEWVSGYGAAEFIYGEEYGTPPIIFKHGNTMASNASTAAKESKENPETHIVRGHGHRIEMHTRTTRAGHYLFSIMLGAFCRTTGEVPSYHSSVDDRGRVVKKQENWQQSVLVIYDYDGHYQFDHISIRDGLAIYRGKVYAYDESD